MAVGANFVGDGLRDLMDPKLRKNFWCRYIRYIAGCVDEHMNLSQPVIYAVYCLDARNCCQEGVKTPSLIRIGSGYETPWRFNSTWSIISGVTGVFTSIPGIGKSSTGRLVYAQGVESHQDRKLLCRRPDKDLYVPGMRAMGRRIRNRLVQVHRNRPCIHIQHQNPVERSPDAGCSHKESDIAPPALRKPV